MLRFSPPRVSPSVRTPKRLGARERYAFSGHCICNKMAIGKNPRFDNSRLSSGYCSTPTVVVFVALCLVGVWMMTSSTVVPAELPKTMSEVAQRVPNTVSKTFKNNAGDVPVDSFSGDTSITNNGQDGFELESSPDKVRIEKAQGERNNNSVDAETEDNQTDRQDEHTERGSGESTSSYQNKNSDQNFDRNENNDRGKGNNSDENTETKVGQENSNIDAGQGAQSQVRIEEKVEENTDKEADQNSADKKTGSEVKDQNPSEVFPDGAQAELLNETNIQNGAWSTQATESKREKEVQATSLAKEQIVQYNWKLCNVIAGPDYIPCLDNEDAIKKLRTTKHYEHRERHCPEEAPTCLVPLPDGYKLPIKWPQSRDKIWYANVPHTKLAVIKASQNWVKATGEYLTFPGGGTQFKHGALHYIDFIQETLPDIAWGKKSRVILDVGCGVASFGGYIFDRDVLTMSFAPKDEHEAQVQFALERGIPAISAVMGTKRLPFPGRVFDVVHCARCRVPWHIEGGILLLELNRLLRPGGYFIWSATPVYQNLPEDKGIWTAMSALTKSMCWDMVAKKKDAVNHVGLAIYRKPLDNVCYEKRKQNNPPLCQVSDDPDAAWNIPLQACMHKLSVDSALRGSQWPEQWPLRLEKTPYWLNSSQAGVYGKVVPEEFQADYEHWKHVVSKSYLNGLGINWSIVRNVMDMSTVYGGFAAALRDLKVWVMNVVPIDSPDTLPIIYERGLFGIYHDWCESLSTYPRSYDLLHADHLFSKLKRRCSLLSVIVEVDRILRPEGKFIVRDNVETINEVENLMKSLHWKVRLTYAKDNEGLLCVQKTMWRPREFVLT